MDILDYLGRQVLVANDTLALLKDSEMSDREMFNTLWALGTPIIGSVGWKPYRSTGWLIVLVYAVPPMGGQLSFYSGIEREEEWYWNDDGTLSIGTWDVPAP